MKCLNKKICAEKHKKWKRNQNKFIPIGEEEHNIFIEHYKNGNAILGLKKYPDQERPHADLRFFQRSVSAKDITDIILHGWVIERNYFSYEQAVRLVILGYTRTYRPLHIVCEIINEREWEIVTVYNPETKKYKWGNNYQERVCFCKLV